MDFDLHDICQFIKNDIYPYYFPVPDRNGNVATGFVMLPRDEFFRRGLQDPKRYYLNRLQRV